ncbi:IclR family transcriptional regulator [Natrarchaeobius halalkaliphilus]|uniref:IclR family transcriptional regulator n=1 Tax=Natrarchaeobius halalkaliphilus TaxID=1679091 RepID=A0A3N6LJG0_9EURY|nr:IclR family transcriptional regulator [Natrarchaeobius halalkaliphilus]RQG88071.1 IclR family transcriptional regulator [Natrarchaeobius halalkaliphilus]
MSPNRNPSDSSRVLQTADTTFEIINVIKSRDGAKATEIAEHLDLSRSAVYNHLTTLIENEWIIRTENSYQLSLKFLMLGVYVRNHNRLFSVGKSEVQKLAQETGETAHLATEQQGYQINLLKETGELAVGDQYHTQKLQQTNYHHDTATGKAMLAFLPEERVETILDKQGLPSKTSNTITDRDVFLEELHEIRERGYSYNDEEEIEGLRAVGAPITDQHGNVLGSVSVSGPTSRLKNDRYHEELPEKVMSTANIIELNLNMERRIDRPNRK